MKSNILTISDGIGVDVDFKKWPFYLSLLTAKTSTIINRSVIGASNEMLFMLLSEAISNNKIDYCIVQWTVSNRIDLIADDFWLQQAKQDPVYHFNIIKNNNKQWWITSASTNHYVQEYHNRYIKFWQSQQRSQTWIMAAAELLKFHNIKFVFSLGYSMTFLEPNVDILDSYPWVWHIKNLGISEFRSVSKYKHFDQKLPQPHTLIQLDWIDKVLKPNCEFVNYNETVYNNIEQAVLKSCSK
jgi:hypothetical protein